MRGARALFISEISRAMFSRSSSLLFSSRTRAPLAFAAELDHKPAPFARPCVRVLESRLARAALRFRVPLIEGAR